MAQDRVALVTGASGGIGRAIAIALAETGAYVYVNYNGSQGKAEETVRLIEEKGGRAEICKFNVGDFEETNLLGGNQEVVIFKSVDISVVLVGILAFGINSGAYVSEIIRAGIQSIPIGQTEAGYSLGLKYGQVMRHIILPQAIRNILPALGNEFITLVKETSVGAYIGVIELTKASDIIASRTYDYFFPLILVAIIYLIITLGLSKGVSKLERKLSYVKN